MLTINIEALGTWSAVAETWGPVFAFYLLAESRWIKTAIVGVAGNLIGSYLMQLVLVLPDVRTYPDSTSHAARRTCRRSTRQSSPVRLVRDPPSIYIPTGAQRP